MESLPPTSATKMIDYWLILCQLVPFIQVVLLTAMEYIRVEDSIAEKEDDEYKEDCTAIDGHQDNCIDLETIGTEQKVQEAWSIQQPNRSKPNLLHKLVLIGKSTVDQLLSPYLVHSRLRDIFNFRKESDAPCSASCLNDLLWNCSKLIFWKDITKLYIHDVHKS